VSNNVGLDAVGRNQRAPLNRDGSLETHRTLKHLIVERDDSEMLGAVGAAAAVDAGVCCTMAGTRRAPATSNASTALPEPRSVPSAAIACSAINDSPINTCHTSSHDYFDRRTGRHSIRNSQ
jgi:hypothetical protein